MKKGAIHSVFEESLPVTRHNPRVISFLIFNQKKGMTSMIGRFSPRLKTCRRCDYAGRKGITKGDEHHRGRCKPAVVQPLQTAVELRAPANRRTRG